MALFRRKSPPPPFDPRELAPTGRGWIESPLSAEEGAFVAVDGALRFYPNGGDVRTIPWGAVDWARAEGKDSFGSDLMEETHPWVFELPSLDAKVVSGWLQPSDEPFVIAPTADHPAPVWIAAMRRAGVEIKAA